MIDILTQHDLFYDPARHLTKGATDKAYDPAAIASRTVVPHTYHSYIQTFYDEAFRPYQKRPIRFLEIGIQTGGSMKLWREYFSHESVIVGVDVSDALIAPRFRHIDGVTYYFRDAYDQRFAASLGPLDIVIDDGPHSLQSQIKAIQLYLPQIREGGMLIIEDVESDKFVRRLQNTVNSVQRAAPPHCLYRTDFLDFRPTLQRSDDMLFVVRRLKQSTKAV